MSDDPVEAWHYVHILWAGLAGIFGFFGKRYMNKVDHLEAEKADADELERKADKDSIDQRFDALDTRIDRLEDRSEDRHTQNTRRLDAILTAVNNGH